MSTLVCLLEEPSAGEMLKIILPKVLPQGTEIKLIAFEGKQDLEKKLEMRIRHWQAPDSYFLVMRDKDSGDCVAIKNRLKEIVEKCGKADRTLIRIACCELESFYLGDLAAVEKGLCLTGCAKRQGERKFRFPDNLANAAEELKRLTGKKYQKIIGSRSIAPHLALDGSNKSHSFRVLLEGVKRMAGTSHEA